MTITVYARGNLASPVSLSAARLVANTADLIRDSWPEQSNARPAQEAGHFSGARQLQAQAQCGERKPTPEVTNGWSA